MENKDYKRIFIRFLKTIGVYEQWIILMNNNCWKGLHHYYWEYVSPPNYLSRSMLSEDTSEKIDGIENIKYFICDLISYDFLWKLICYKIDEKNWNEVENFINSRYFRTPYVTKELYEKYKSIKKNYDVPIPNY